MRSHKRGLTNEVSQSVGENSATHRYLLVICSVLYLKVSEYFFAWVYKVLTKTMSSDVTLHIGMEICQTNFKMAFQFRSR